MKRLIIFLKRYKFSLLSGILSFIIANIIIYKMYFIKQDTLTRAILFSLPFFFVVFMEIDYIKSHTKRKK